MQLSNQPSFTVIVAAFWSLLKKNVSLISELWFYCYDRWTTLGYIIFSPLQSKEGKSPLHMAAIHGRFTRSQILIQNGNDDCAVWLMCEKMLLQAFSPHNGFLIHSSFPTFPQVGKLIVWISMAILLSTLLLSMAMNCWSALWWPTEQTRPGIGEALSDITDQYNRACGCKNTVEHSF